MRLYLHLRFALRILHLPCVSSPFLLSPPLLCSASDSDFQQQRLKAWQPLLTPLWIVATFVIVGVVFVVIGAVILATTNSVVEVRQRYDAFPASTNSSACDLSTAQSSPTRSCFPVSIPSDMAPPVFVYYQLTNFYQNHRRYVKSRSDGQLQGGASPPFTTCEPLATNPDDVSYYPCGLIAASTFNDTLNASLCTSATTSACQDLSSATFSNPDNPSWKKSGIAWPSDVANKFRAITPSYPYTNTSWDGHRLPYVDDEDFIVWMRTAGLPSFKKLYRQITDRTLPAGAILLIQGNDQFPVAQYGGEKWLVLSTTSWMGGKNEALGWMYVAVGIACVLVAAVFAIKQLLWPRKWGELPQGRTGAARGGAGAPSGEERDNKASSPREGGRGSRGGGGQRGLRTPQQQRHQGTAARCPHCTKTHASA